MLLSELEISKIERAGKISLPFCLRWRLSAEIFGYTRDILAMQRPNVERAIFKRIASTAGSLVNDLNNSGTTLWIRCDRQRLIGDLESLQNSAREMIAAPAPRGRPDNPVLGSFLCQLASIFTRSGGGSTAVVKDADQLRTTDGFINFAMAVFNTMPEATRPSSSMALASRWERIHSQVTLPLKRPSIDYILRA